MHVLVFADDHDPMPSPLKRRLHRAGLSSSMVSPEVPIPTVALEDAEMVMLVPEPLLDAPVWAGLRVRLARSGRFFAVAGGEMSTEQVVRATQDGAQDVLDWDRDDLLRWQRGLQRMADSQALWLKVYGALATGATSVGLLGDSESTRSLRQTIRRLGPTDVSVMILGASGTGKERVAQSLHEARGLGPFVALNCAAIPRDLLESELFGSEKGAFTGAWRERAGLVEQASGGTLFLDEIGEMDPALQPKLLRFLETRTARRVGGAKDYQVQLRVIAATNRNLETEMAAGRFRPDLYFRLAEVMIQLPPLRARPDDLPALVMAFIGAANERFGKTFLGVEPVLMERFRGYSWPGNVRELRSVIDRLAVLHDGSVMRSGWWEPPVTAPTPPSPGSHPAAAHATGHPETEGTLGSSAGLGGAPLMPPRRQRQEIARRLMAEGQLSQTEIAARLGVHPTTLFRWRKGLP